MSERQAAERGEMVEEEAQLRLVALMLCDLCLSGTGGECHVPGCALWMNRAPDVPLRDKVVANLELEPVSEAEGSRAAAMLDEFHTHPNADERTNSESLRLTLHQEEHRELEVELDRVTADRAKIARELADVVYVAYGTALVFWIDLDAALAEIHRAAMRKLEANCRRPDGKIIKPPGFVPPDMSEAVRERAS